jgi:hypothetical protein
MAWIKCTSQRAWERVNRTLGYRLQAVMAVHHSRHYVAQISDEAWAQICAIPGVAQIRDPWAPSPPRQLTRGSL